MKVYIIGKASAKTHSEDHSAFSRVREELQASGHQVCWPYSNTIPGLGDQDEECRDRLRVMMGCNAVAVMPSWNESKISITEMVVAIQTNMQIIKCDYTVIPARIVIQS